MEPRIVMNSGSPRIEGTRISVYNILESLRQGWHPTAIAGWFDLSTAQVDAAIRYIDEHRDDVEKEYAGIRDRLSRGNAPEVVAKLNANADILDRVREKLKQGESMPITTLLVAESSGGQAVGRP